MLFSRVLLVVRVASAAVVHVHSPKALEGEFVPQPHVELPSALGRTAYRHVEHDALWLFHWHGRWLFGDAPGVDAAVAFIDSFAVTPCDFSAASPRARWMQRVDGAWSSVPPLNLSCAPPRALYHGPGNMLDNSCTPSSATLSPTLTLANGVRMPRVGLGTAGLHNDEQVLRWALAAGYELIDTASLAHPAYDNEALVGAAVHEHAAWRRRRQPPPPQAEPSRHSGGGVFISTKLSPASHGLLATRAAMSEALRTLRVDQVDLMLIHHPTCLMRAHSDPCEVRSSRGAQESALRAS